MKNIKYLFFSIFAVLFMGINVNAQTVEMTADELLATVEENIIKLENDIILTTNLKVPESVKVLDLNGNTITLKGCMSSNQANPIFVNYDLEIKNGTITRYVASSKGEKSLIQGSLITIKGQETDVTINNVILDGKNLEVKTATDSYHHAVSIINGASITISDSKLINNKTVTGTSNWSSTIYANGATRIIINNTEISSNKNEDINRGGIVWIKDAEEVKIINSVIKDNDLVGNGILSVENCENFIFDKDSIIKNNVAKESSGIMIQNSNATISGTIEGNETTANDGNGAGIYTYLDDSKKIVTITDTAVIRNNVAGGAGAGIYVNGNYSKNVIGNEEGFITGKVVMNGGLITGNVSNGTPNKDTLKDGGGAGVYVARGTMIINGGTIEGNTSNSKIGDAIVVSHANGNVKAGKLDINGGIILGSIDLGIGTLSINGGTFSQDISEYVIEGLSTKIINDNYVVGREYEVKVNETTNGKVTVDKTNAIPGETVKITVTPNEGYEIKTLKVVDNSGKEISIKDNEFKMTESNVEVKVEFNKIETTTDIPVINTEDEIKEVVIGVNDKKEVEKVLLDSLLANEEIKDLVEKESIKVAVEIEKAEISKEDEKKITETVKTKYENIVVSQYFDITVAVKNAENKEIATISKLTDKIELVVALSEDLKTVEEGKSRNYYVIRQHGDEIEIINNVKLSEDGKSLIFETDRFSTYAIAYEDINVIAPETGDSTILYIMLSGLSIAGIYSAIKLIKKKKLFN